MTSGQRTTRMRAGAGAEKRDLLDLVRAKAVIASFRRAVES
jgi:hypothetical protein